MLLLLGLAFAGGVLVVVVVLCGVIAWAMFTGRLEIRITENPSIVLVGEEQRRRSS
jgi:hypothetical protein